MKTWTGGGIGGREVGQVIFLSSVREHLEAAERCKRVAAEYEPKTRDILRGFGLMLRARAVTMARGQTRQDGLAPVRRRMT
jgi:hypothetical protein